MKRLAGALAFPIALGGAVFAADTDPAPVSKLQPLISGPRLERAIHDLVNAERGRHGLAPLGWDARLAAVARGHSGDMAGRRYFSHATPEGADFAARYRNGRYDCALRVGNVIHGGAENIAMGTLYAKVTTVNGEKFFDWNSEARLAARTVQGWMASPGHRRNILTPHWGREGIGLAIGADDRIYVTQNFC